MWVFVLRTYFITHLGWDEDGLHCVQPKFESVYLHAIKKHRNNLLFSYYELGFRFFSLIYFRTASILFDLKNLNLSKHFERLT